MPGHMLSAHCPGGFTDYVQPGSPRWGEELVIAYQDRL